MLLSDSYFRIVYLFVNKQISIKQIKNDNTNRIESNKSADIICACVLRNYQTTTRARI